MKLLQKIKQHKDLEEMFMQERLSWARYFYIIVQYGFNRLNSYVRCDLRGDHDLEDRSTEGNWQNGAFHMECRRCGKQYSGYW